MPASAKAGAPQGLWQSRDDSSPLTSEPEESHQSPEVEHPSSSNMDIVGLLRQSRLDTEELSGGAGWSTAMKSIGVGVLTLLLAFALPSALVVAGVEKRIQKQET